MAEIQFEGEAYVYKEVESKAFSYNEGIIKSAKMSVNYTSTGDYMMNLFLTANGGTHWESVSNGVNHIFITPGNDVRWKITGTGPFYVTKITITYTIGG